MSNNSNSRVDVKTNAAVVALEHMYLVNILDGVHH